MKKKIGLIMSMLLLFVFVFSFTKNDYAVYAQNNATKVGQQLLQPEEGWKRIEEDNNNFSYIKGKYTSWIRHADSNAYSGGYSMILNDTSSEVNGYLSKVKFNVVTDKIRIIMFSRYYCTNNIEIKIDGIPYIFEARSYNQIRPTVCFEKKDLVYKEHTVEITNLLDSNTNNMMYFDAIDIDKNGQLKPYEETTKVESISLDKTSMDLLEGSSDKINAKVLPEDAPNKKVVWSSSDEKIVTVDKDGKVTAMKEGQATITAKVEGTDLTATCKVNVTKKVGENKNNAILSISLVNGATKEYDVSMQEVEKFINWFEERSNGKGPSLYSFNKKINPYKTVKEYIVHDKIASFEVREYEGTNK
ncbi:Ig-like domain-containing protein [Clostridium sporogenes]|uniref:Ig-like domain-containing protein n=1 Tax=Clostridium sporogenes TaxID=1509 RepID=UPI00223862FF|nr:Ig-like domain-containing protein [Clostridium sporogenes]MCW6110101.1 Ig-like domain-containing protein [Clostridium sporogenes]